MTASRGIGLSLVVISSLLVLREWAITSDGDPMDPKFVVMGPVLLCLGLAMVVFPGQEAAQPRSRLPAVAFLNRYALVVWVLSALLGVAIGALWIARLQGVL